MTIYVQSRGVAQDNDYRWLKIAENEATPETPQILLRAIDNLAIKPIKLIDSQKFSLILLSVDNHFCLLVTGLKTRKERTDFMGRPVRNSILWTCDKDRDNLNIRSLLILALRGELDREVDKAIDISGKYGFTVNYNRLKKLSNSTLAIGNNYQADPNCKIGKNCDSLREEIALELESNVLPNKKGLLVLITSIKSASKLKETKVWRGLSNRVESEKLEKYTSSSISQSQPQKKTLWLGIAIALASIIAIALITTKLTFPLQPQIEPNSPNSDKSKLWEENSGISWEKGSTSIELPSACQNQPETDYFLSPCSSNVKNN